tara:strand:- start:1012 stop:3609 length:2598 start_codon:yes stop_codon:yes gene_type:complete
MKVCLLGNIANNAYNMAKTLNAQGIRAELIDDGLDTFPLSRPIWEEIPIVWTYKKLMKSRSLEDWVRIENRLGLSDTPEIWRPSEFQETAKNIFSLLFGKFKKTRNQTTVNMEIVEELLGEKDTSFNQDEWNFLYSTATAHYESIVKLQEANVAIVFGIRAAACAYIAKIPTIYFTYGGDMRLELAGKSGGGELIAKLFTKLLSSENFVIDAYGCDEEIHNLLVSTNLYKKSQYAFLPNVNKSLFGEHADTQSVREELKLPKDKIIFFMPSRIDFHWKGTDKFLMAFDDIARGRDDLLLISTGWGKDFMETSKKTFPKDVVFLDKCFSKVMLKKYYSAADVVIDQFKVGSFGSVSFEALCLGKPVITYLAPFNLANYPIEPPILNARSTEDIKKTISLSADNPQLRKKLSVNSAEWYKNVYNEESFARIVSELSEKGPNHWPEIAGQKTKVLPDAKITVPNSNGKVTILAWPYPFKAGLTIANDCEYYEWNDFIELHNWIGEDTNTKTAYGQGLGLPFSDSFWFYSDNQKELGFSYFEDSNGQKRSKQYGLMSEMIQSGKLDTLHTYGGFDLSGAFSRKKAEIALEELQKIGAKLKIWSNHGNHNNVQNLRGLGVADYAVGCTTESESYHADITLEAGIKYYWLDNCSTNRFSIGNSLGRGFSSSSAEDDKTLWGDRISKWDTLQDNRKVITFRRFRGKSKFAPTLDSLDQQLSNENLQNLIQSKGCSIVYQHLGCIRDPDGTPRSRGGRPIPTKSKSALIQLADLFHEKSIWVAPLSKFLEYVDVSSNLRIRFEQDEKDNKLILFREDGKNLDQAQLVNVHLKFTERSIFSISGIYLESSDGSLHKTEPNSLKQRVSGDDIVYW